MGKEIEKKFLLKNNSWIGCAVKQELIRQAYLANSDRASVRVRIQAESANLNVKSMTIGISREEYEYPIPMADAELIMKDLCSGPEIIKTRHYLEFEGHTWEIDVFSGDNSGLVVAEIELSSAGEAFAHPPWLGKEVSHDERYYNVALVENPYKNWVGKE